MGRPRGSRNPGYEDRRRKLADALGRAVTDPAAGHSFQELARACGVSVPTLKHYFGDRDGAILAGFEALEDAGRRHATAVPGPEGLPPRESLLGFLSALILGWRRFGVGQLHRVGLQLGLTSERRGPGYVTMLLEPSLRYLEERIAFHQDHGDLRGDDPRAAALSLLAPVMLALLHQDQLGGSACRPLDVEAFTEEHLDRWLGGWAA